MTILPQDQQIQATDKRGRVRVTPERRTELLNEFDRSGMTARRFAEWSGVSYQTFTGWIASGGTSSQEKRSSRLNRAISRPGADGDSRRANSGPSRRSLETLEQRDDESMLSFTGSLRVFLSVEPCDMRKGFNGLLGLVSERLQEDIRQGALFVFCNHRHTRLKILYFDGTGLWLMTKRLEQGTFAWPKASDHEAAKLRLTPEAFAMLTDGIDLRGAKMRPWYEREN